MKFQKTAIAATIAGFAALPMVASADTVLSGTINIKVQGTDEDGDAGDPNIAADDIRFAITSEHELNNGLIGYGNIQLNIDDLTGEGGPAVGSIDVDNDGSISDEEQINLNASATTAADEIYVGIRGGFGNIRIGEIPLAIEYGQLANDIHDVGEAIEDGISYTGTFGIFGIGLNYSPDFGGLDDDTASTNSDTFGIGARFNFAGATIGVGFEDRGSDGGDDEARIAVGASYAIAGISIAAHYWVGETDFDPDIVINTEADDQVDTSGFSIDDTESFAVQLGYSIAGVSLGVTYSTIDSSVQTASAQTQDELIVANDESIIRFDAGYDFGGDTVISTRLQQALDDDSDDSDDDLFEYRVMLTKNF